MTNFKMKDDFSSPDCSGNPGMERRSEAEPRNEEL